MSTTVPEEHREVLEAPYAVLTTLGRDGYPQSTMVAFLAEDSLVRISLNTTRQKTRNLMSRPRATLLIPDPASPYRTLEIRGDVEITPDEDYSFARRVGQKYGGTDFRSADRTPQQPLEPGSLAGEQRSRVGLVHPRLLGSGSVEPPNMPLVSDVIGVAAPKAGPGAIAGVGR